MTIGQYGYDCSLGPNPDFVSLAKCREDVCSQLGLNLSDMELSMGMSSDFEHAVSIIFLKTSLMFLFNFIHSIRFSLLSETSHIILFSIFVY